MSDAAPRPKIGRFELIQRLGGGLQGKVYLGWDPMLQRKVAIKVITNLASYGVGSQEVVAEARISAKIAHPNVIPLYEATLFKNTPVLVFEFVEGTTLKQAIKDHGPYNENEALSIMVRIAVGLKAAHEQGIVHLDLSPNNIMIEKESGRPRIMDFGLARLTAATGVDDTQSGLVGTPRYMSPEHLTEHDLTAATDVFSLGLIFFELLTGQPAMNQDQMKKVLAAVSKAQIDWSRLQTFAVSPEVVALMRDMLYVDPDTRMQSAVELVQSLDAILEMRKQRDPGDLALKFILRRLDRRPEFPAFSHSIVEVNRLTDATNTANYDKLANAILRDYSLTNRLMKVANSAYFDRGTGGVKTVSQAVARLGLNMIRMMCNGLLLFDHLGGRNPKLEEAMVSSFISGLISRHLAQRNFRQIAEEAFICGLFHRLGRNLLSYYLEDEYQDIDEMVAQGTPPQQAELAVLSTTSAAIGVAIARKWKFPDTIISAMDPLPGGVIERPDDKDGQLRVFANFGNELCTLAQRGDLVDDPIMELDRFHHRYRSVYPGKGPHLVKLLEAAFEKFAELAPALGVDVTENGCCVRLSAFVANGLKQLESMEDGVADD